MAAAGRSRPFVIRRIFRSVATLAARDTDRALRFVVDAEELGEDDPFTPAVLEELGKLIRGSWIGYDEKDVVGKRCLLAHEHPSFDEIYGTFDFASAAVAVAESPLRRHQEDDHFEAIRLSDLLPQRALRRTSYHSHVLEPLGVTDQLGVAIPSPRTHAKRFLFDRVGGGFSTRDRLVLDFLQPHLKRLWRAAETRRRLRAALASLEWSCEHDPRGVALLDSGGRLEFVSPAARRLIRTYFMGQSATGVAPALGEWLESGSATLVRRQADRRLTLDRSGDALLLEETRDELLTPREQEILAWVAEGKTNPEIAEILWVSTSTVRKHLENIYAKLGVHTRTAAVYAVSWDP